MYYLGGINKMEKLKLKNYLKVQIDKYSILLESELQNVDDLDYQKIAFINEMLGVLREIERICIVRNKF